MEKQAIIELLSEILPNVSDSKLKGQLEKFIKELETPEGNNKEDPGAGVSKSKARKLVKLVSDIFLKAALTEGAKEIIEKLMDMF